MTTIEVRTDRDQLAPVDFDILKALIRLRLTSEPPLFRDLADELGLDTSEVVRRLRRLKQLGFVTWSPHYLRSLSVRPERLEIFPTG